MILYKKRSTVEKIQLNVMNVSTIRDDQIPPTRKGPGSVGKINPFMS